MRTMRTWMLLLPVAMLVLGACATSDLTPDTCPSITLGDESLSPEALIERVGVAEAEAKNMSDGVPFGDRNEEWRALKNDIMPGDELWLYRDNRTIAGSEGYLLVRDCDVIAFVMTMKY